MLFGLQFIILKYFDLHTNNHIVDFSPFLNYEFAFMSIPSLGCKLAKALH